MAAVAPREVECLGLIAPAGLWLDAHPIPDLFSKLPHELPGLLFHNPEFGERMMTAGADFDDPKFLEAFIIRNTRQLAMAGKMLFPIPTVVSRSGSTASAPRPSWSGARATG